MSFFILLSADEKIHKRNAQIAQLVEQRTENPRVAGSIPALGIFAAYFYYITVLSMKKFTEALFFYPIPFV